MSSGDVDAGSDAVLLGSPSSGSVEWDTNVTVTEQSAPGIANHIRVARTGRKHSAHYKVIIVGESGLGKTTARECLLHDLLNPTHHSTRSPGQITERTADIHTSDAMQLRTDSDIEDLFLRIVDTPGYGDHRDVGEDIGKIEAFIRLQYEKLYDAKDEDGNIDPVHHDSLVTCCLYFIAPHRIKDNDIEFLRKVSELVPIVPVIAKADTMTRDETTEFRQIVSDKLKQAGITCYDFNGDARIAARDGLPPFTLIADKGMRERKYAWGTCDLSNEAHSDFVLLKELVIKEHLERMHTQAFKHYETYRKDRHANEVGGGWEPPKIRKYRRSLIATLQGHVPAKRMPMAEVALVIQAMLALLVVAWPFLCPMLGLGLVCTEAHVVGGCATHEGTWRLVSMLLLALYMGWSLHEHHRTKGPKSSEAALFGFLLVLLLDPKSTQSLLSRLAFEFARCAMVDHGAMHRQLATDLARTRNELESLQALSRSQVQEHTSQVRQLRADQKAEKTKHMACEDLCKRERDRDAKALQQLTADITEEKARHDRCQALSKEQQQKYDAVLSEGETNARMLQDCRSEPASKNKSWFS